MIYASNSNIVNPFFHKNGKDKYVCISKPDYSNTNLKVPLHYFSFERYTIVDENQGPLTYLIVKHEHKRDVINYISKLALFKIKKHIPDFNAVIDSKYRSEKLLIQEDLVDNFEQKMLELFYIDMFLEMDISNGNGKKRFEWILNCIKEGHDNLF